MKITSNKPDENQSYKNNFKENGVYPFSKITRVITDKKTGQILQVLNENDSSFDRDFKKSIFDETKHDIMCMFPKFYYRRNWEDEELEDCIVTDIPPEHINFIPESISDKSFEVFPCFVREDGSIRDYVLYSAFEGSIVDGQLRSIPNEEVVVDKTLDEFRGFARVDRDEKFNIENMSVIAMIQFLYKIGFQDLNSQKVLGKGWVKKQNKTKTGGTLKLGNRSGYQDPFANSPDKPDDRISLSFRAGENGELAMYNAKSSDQMPIKTINMNGLQKWEETDDYIIYIDKDAVMTTVANYVTGTYDLFKESKADIDGAMELLRDNDIEWTAEDDSKLILDINKAQLERIVNTPTTMEEEDAVPQTFTTRAVPTTYECCFRVDKKEKNFYIGEGYENLFVPPWNTSGVKVTKFDNYDKVEITSANYPRYEKVGLSSSSKYSFSTEVLELVDGFLSSVNGAETSYALKLKIGYNSKVFGMPTWGTSYGIWHGTPKIGDYILLRNLQLTKTDTPKPFVKSIMPSGKLKFISNSTSYTHSFIFKDNLCAGHGAVMNHTLLGDTAGNEAVEFQPGNLGFVSDVIVSKEIVKYSKDKINYTADGLKRLFGGISNNGVFGLKYLRDVTDRSFKQLLIYKGNLTEAELKAENEKNIIADNQIDNNEYPPQYNSNSLFGIENFYGNVKRIVDGFIVKDDGYYHITHPNKIGQTSAYEKLPCQVITGGSNGVEGWSKKIDKQLGVFNIPSELNEQKDVVSVVTREILEYFDFADGKGTETALKSRVSESVLNLVNFDFDENSGWTGKGLKFDGVDDNYTSTLDKTYSNLEEWTIEYCVTNWNGPVTRIGPASGDAITTLNDKNSNNYVAWKQLVGFKTQTNEFYTLTAIATKTECIIYHNGVEAVKVDRTDLRNGTIAKITSLILNNFYSSGILHCLKVYGATLTPEEIAQNYEYEQSIDRTTVTTYPLLQEQKSYGIGLSNQLSEEQKSTFRLSVDGTKFVAGLRYCEGLEVEEFTYSEIQVEMEKEEWSKVEEEEFESDTSSIEQNTKTQSSIEEHILTSKSNTKTVEETHYTDYFLSHAPNKENIAIFGSDFEAEEKAGVFTLDLNKEINHKDDRTSARLVILP